MRRYALYRVPILVATCYCQNNALNITNWWCIIVCDYLRWIYFLFSSGAGINPKAGSTNEPLQPANSLKVSLKLECRERLTIYEYDLWKNRVSSCLLDQLQSSSAVCTGRLDHFFKGASSSLRDEGNLLYTVCSTASCEGSVIFWCEDQRDCGRLSALSRYSWNLVSFSLLSNVPTRRERRETTCHMSSDILVWEASRCGGLLSRERPKLKIHWW